MGQYDVQQVCLNGHQITAHYNNSSQHRRKFCDQCGAATIHKCPSCSQEIPGFYSVPNVISFRATSVPTHCANCGESFPWTKAKENIISISDSSEIIDFFGLVEKLCSRFHLIAKQMQVRHAERNSLIIEDEYDVQDLLHALLHIYFEDIRSEEWTPSYAGGSSRVDFLLKDEKIVVEIKKTRVTLKARHVGEQLIIDSQRYKAHPDCKKLLCFVYDPEGFISNPRGLENDLNAKTDDFEIKVLIVPKGH
jgi:DNA-directed RNA polymerase subunit N (RpoN/RPB10)